jgi:hypothetical protein
MNEKLKKEIDEKQTFPGFIKTSDSPLEQLTAEQKAKLNRKGNVFFNEGNIENARKIFVSTGYSDGLTRIGDYYYKEHKDLDALKFYLLAHNTQKAEVLLKKAADLISVLMQE